MNAFRKIWPAYLTGFVISLAIMVGFILGMMVHNQMALDAIDDLSRATRAAILEAGS